MWHDVHLSILLRCQSIQFFYCFRVQLIWGQTTVSTYLHLIAFNSCLVNWLPLLGLILCLQLIILVLGMLLSGLGLQLAILNVIDLLLIMRHFSAQKSWSISFLKSCFMRSRQEYIDSKNASDICCNKKHLHFHYWSVVRESFGK